MAIGVDQAAERLAVSRRRVRHLIEAGKIHAQLISGSYQIDEDSVDALAELDRPAHVRSFSRRMAWASAALADGVQPGWITASEISRLRSRMDRLDANPAGWVTRLHSRAAATTTVRAGLTHLPGLLTDKQVSRSGVSATNRVTDAQAIGGVAELWVPDQTTLLDLATTWGLLTSRSGNVTVREAGVSGLASLGTGDGNAYRLIVAADLLAGADSRARSAGTDLLEATLGQRLWRRTRE